MFLSFLLLTSAYVYGENIVKSIQVTYRNISIQVNGKLLPSEQEPFIYQGRTFVPLRTIGEAVNKTVEWNNTKNQIKILDPVSIVTRLGSYYELLNYFPDHYSIKVVDEKLTADEILKIEEFFKKLNPIHKFDSQKGVRKSYNITKDGKSMMLFLLWASNNCICLRYNDGSLYFFLATGTNSWACGSSDGLFQHKLNRYEQSGSQNYYLDYLTSIDLAILRGKPEESKRFTDLYAIYMWMDDYLYQLNKTQ